MIIRISLLRFNFFHFFQQSKKSGAKILWESIKQSKKSGAKSFNEVYNKVYNKKPIKNIV